MENTDLFVRKITWKQHKSIARYFFCFENDSLILLRINNFPDEQLYTLINGLEITEFDDRPKNWIIPINT